MPHFRVTAMLVIALALPQPSSGQEITPQQMQKRLDVLVVNTKSLQKPMPLSKWLTAVAKQLPEKQQLTLEIDKHAFGNQFAKVADTSIALPKSPREMSLRQLVKFALTKIKTKADYRLQNGRVILTTPARALYPVHYDIRDIKTGTTRHILDQTGLAWNEDKALLRPKTSRAAFVVRNICSQVDPQSWHRTTAHHGTIQIENGTQLIIRTNADRHARIDEVIRALRRLGDLAVFVSARLYEVDQAFYTKLNNLKRPSLEEEERRFLAGLPNPGDALYKLLPKQKLLQTGPRTKADSGAEVALLSRQRVVRCLPNPRQIQTSKTKEGQTILVGVAFRGQIRVSADRRYVGVKLMENVTEIEAIRKTKVFAWRLLNDGPSWRSALQQTAEEVFLTRTAQSRVAEISDGGSVLVPVRYRPVNVKANNRYWVLLIEARIYIEKEETLIRNDNMAAFLPTVIADVLNNPRLQAQRTLYSGPGDKRFALLDSDAWTWPNDLRPKIAGRSQVPATGKGNRLLGIRVEKYDEPLAENANGTLTVTLTNAGGSANGAVVGECSVRYHVRQTGDGWEVKLLSR